MARIPIVMTAAHGGYDSESVPLGGGAAVCERLCALWKDSDEVDLTLLGSGPGRAGVNYRSFPTASGRLPSNLNEWDYARFCRDFEQATTEYILGRTDRPVVISHDISEGPNFQRLALAGIRCIPTFHVDVVDYFNRFYLGDLLPPSWWTALHRGLRSWFPVPDLLQLVFEKQQLAVQHSPFLVVPSQPMEGILRRCYPDTPKGRIQVIPWGSPVEQPDPGEVAVARQDLIKEWGLAPGAPVLLTLSRISPEKNQELLLAAMRQGEIPPELVVVIAGEAAYMRGTRYRNKLQTLAKGLKVIFPGHLGGARKRAALELATLFVVPSCHESYGLTTMEAMAASLPVVGVRSYGVESTLDEDCGVLVSPRPAELWAAILGLLRNPQERERLARGAQRRASSQSFSAAAEQLVQLAARLGPAQALPGKASFTPLAL